MTFLELEKNLATQHALPLGAVVIYRCDDNVAKLIVVQHSRDCDGTPLYMVGQEPLEPPPSRYKIYSTEYLVYRLHVGWFAGNVPAEILTDTGERVATVPFLETEAGRQLGMTGHKG